MKFIITVAAAGSIVFAFLNPWWSNINTSPMYLSLILWACHNLAFSLGILALIVFAPFLTAKLKMEDYQPIDTFGGFVIEEVVF